MQDTPEMSNSKMPTRPIKQEHILCGDRILAIFQSLTDASTHIETLSDDLSAINEALWAHEERVRDRLHPDEQVVALKRAIDGLNLARHQAVRALDLAVDAHFSPVVAHDAPHIHLNSESVGQMVDRLSILALKLKAHKGTPVHGALVARTAHLIRCIDRVLDGLAAGEVPAQAFDEAKTYSA